MRKPLTAPGALVTLSAITVGWTLALPTIQAQNSKATLEAASKALGADSLTSLQFSASGAMFAFGQAYHPGQPWPGFNVTNYAASIDFNTPAMLAELDRTNPDGPVRGGGGLPLLAPQHQIQGVSGEYAWGVFDANPGPNGEVAPPVPAPAALQERLRQIWTATPQGVIKAAQKAGADTKVTGRVITFPAAGVIMKATLGGDSLVQKVEWTADAPVAGDVAFETTYSTYRNFEGLRFPARIVHKQGGFPVLELVVTEVNPNHAVGINVPPNVRQAGTVAAPPKVDTQKIADGVYYLTGGTHHSVAIEFRDHVVIVEAPQSEARALAVLEAASRAIANKPITFVVNTHHHFDHAAGVRAMAARGITILSQTDNKSYYEKLLPKMPLVEAVAQKRVLSDGTRELDLLLCRTDHADTMLVAYLPKEKILIEADMFQPPANNAPLPPGINRVSVQLYDWIVRTKLDVDQILPLHGRATNLRELRAAAGKSG